MLACSVLLAGPDAAILHDQMTAPSWQSKRADTAPTVSALAHSRPRENRWVAYAALAIRASSHCDQISDKAVISRSMSPSVCTGEGVILSRSVPTGTVG